jgi:hypothetical protein
MIGGRHMTRLHMTGFLSCLVFLLLANCGRQGFQSQSGGSSTASVLIVIAENPNGELVTTFDALWLGKTTSVDTVDPGATQAWGSQTITMPATGQFSFPVVTGLQVGSWTFEGNLTLGHLSGTPLGNTVCTVTLYSSNTNIITFTVQLDQSGHSYLTCSAPVGSARPKWPPSKG